MEYSLDYQLAADQTGLQPIVDTSAPSNITKQVTVCVCVCVCVRALTLLLLCSVSSTVNILWYVYNN